MSTPSVLVDDVRSKEIIKSILPPERVGFAQFARCAVTGEWAPCICIDLGHMVLSVPDRDTLRQDEVGQLLIDDMLVKADMAMSISMRGLELLQEMLAGGSAGAAPPGFTPFVTYQWRVMYHNGSAISRYEIGDGGVEVERFWREVDESQVAQIHLVPRSDEYQGLPTYAYVVHTNKFFRNGQPLDDGFNEAMPEGSRLICARKCEYTCVSGPGADGFRHEAVKGREAVLHLLGRGLWSDKGPTVGRMIAVSNSGEWRPWDNVTQ